jgi:O-antigen/teichoic acid export membrane protein
MVDILLDPPPRRAVALLPSLGPLVRHGGGFGVFLVLAAMIGPHEYGLFLLALSGVAIVSTLLARSASYMLDVAAMLDELHWSTALVTLIVAGATTSLLVSAIAFVVGPLVDEASFGDLVRSLTVLPFLEAMAVVPRAALRREGRPAALRVADIGGMAAGGCVAVWLAWAGTGAWSLVAQIVVQRLVECVVLWAIPGKRIGILWSWRHLTDLCRMLDWRAAAAVLADVKRPAVLLIVGLCLGPTAAGGPPRR